MASRLCGSTRDPRSNRGLDQFAERRKLPTREAILVQPCPNLAAEEVGRLGPRPNPQGAVAYKVEAEES